MSEHIIFDDQHRVIAKLRNLAFDDKSNAYTGSIEFVNAPAGLVSALKELEHNVDTQQLWTAEELQHKVDDFNLFVSLDDDVISPICDLFVNGNMEASFRIKPAVYPWLKGMGNS